MRVLHVVTAFPRVREDVITPWLVELIKRQRGAGYHVDVFTSAYRGLGDQVLDGIPVYRFRYFLRRWENLTHEETAPDRMRRSLLYRVLPLWFVTFGMVAIWRHCRRRRYDVIHVHWPVPLALFGWAAQRAGPTGLVTTVYGVEVRWVKRSLRFLKGFLAWAARRSDQVVAISTDTARELREVVDVPVEVIPYTTSLPDVGTGIASKPSGGPVLFVGRLVERKGVRHLIEAVARLGDHGPTLEVIGDGPERPALQARAHALGVADRVVIRGKVTTEELQASYARAAVFVLPSVLDARGDTEGLGVVLVEAMNYATPVVASRIGGIPDIVEDGVSGLLVPAGDSAALAAAIGRLIADQGLARRLGDAGRARVLERFGWEAIIRRWKDIYGAVAARRPTSE